MAAKQTAKLLRIGILQGGRIVEERLLQKRETVTIGESPKSTFVVPFTNMPIPKIYQLFLFKKTHYDLVITDKMGGKVTIDGKATPLKDLMASGKLSHHGGSYVLKLEDSMRGMVSIGEVTVLFQFVQAPPLPARPKLPKSIRGGWIKSVDWTFLTIIFISFLLQGGFVVYAATQPMPKKVEIEDLPDRFGKLLPPPSLPEKKKQDAGKDEGKIEDKKEAKSDKKDSSKDEANKKRPLSDQELAEAAARRKAEIAKKVAGAGLVHLLTVSATSGGSLNALQNTLTEGGRFGNIDETMQGISGIGVAEKATERGRRGGGGGGPESKEIEKVGVGEGGAADLGGREEKAVKGSANIGALEVDGSLDADAIKGVIRRHLPAITSCYEQELRRNPKLAGKIYVEITVSITGSVSRAEITSSTLKNSSVESCIVDTIKRWRFPKPPDGEVVFSYPFIFEAIR